MVKDIQLVLTNPCSRQWSELQHADEGRYCDRCDKTILDLTAKSDAELLEFFKKKKDNVCGQLLSSQLNRKLVLPSSKRNWQWLLSLAAGAMTITPAQAQELKPVVVQSPKTPAQISASASLEAQVPILQDTISGQVIDSLTSEPLSGVKVRQKGFQNVLAITDIKGKFHLSLLKADLALPFTFEWSDRSRAEAYLKDNMVVKLVAATRVMLGGISAVSPDQKPSFIVYSGKNRCMMNASKLADLSPDWIEKLEVLKGAKATAIYGAKAANGVILIEIKKAYADRIDFSKKEL